MSKPKKSLKHLGKIADLLSKQTARSAKALSKRKTGDDEDAVLTPFYSRLEERNAAALADLSEITRVSETLALQIVEADAAKSARKSKNKAAAKIDASKKSASNGKSAAPAAKRAPRTQSKSASSSAR